MTTSKVQQQLDEARGYMRCIRQEFDKIEDIFAHAGGFRSGAFNDSLMRAWQHVEGARIHALQVAIPKQRE